MTATIEVDAPPKPATVYRATFSRDDLAARLAIVERGISGRSPMHVLSHVLFRSDADGLRLRATDLEVDVSCAGQDQLDPQTASFCLPHKTLTEVLAALPKGAQVEISVDDKAIATLTSGRSRFTLLGITGDDFPVPWAVEQSAKFELPSARLRSMLNAVNHAVSTDETRVMICGVLMESAGGKLNVIATDTHRLAVVSMASGAPSGSSVLPGRAARELVQLLPDSDDPVQVVIDAHAAGFILPGNNGVIFRTRLIEGNFPNWQRVIPAAASITVTVDRAALLASARRSLVVWRDTYRVVITVTAATMTLDSESPIAGSFHEQIDCESPGETRFALNAQFIAATLDSITTKRVTLAMTDPLKPVLVTPVWGDTAHELEYREVVIPMQIPGA